MSGILVNYLQILLCILAVAACVIVIIGTVNHPNLQMESAELAKSKKCARGTVVTESGIIYLFSFLGINSFFVYYMSMAVIICAVLMLVAKIIKQEVELYE